MEEVLTLMLFTYPGALSEMVYNHIAQARSHRDEDIKDHAAIARDFFISVIVSVVSMSICRAASLTAGSIPDASSPKEIALYAAVSCIISIIAGLVWYAAAETITELSQKKADKTRSPSKAHYRVVWANYLLGKDIKARVPIIAVRNSERKIITSGFVQEMSEDPSKDAGLVLIGGWAVGKEIDLWEKGKAETLLDGPLGEYYDMSTGTIYELWDGTRLHAKLTHANQNPSDPAVAGA